MTWYIYFYTDFTKKWNAYLRLISPWKRVYCCYNNASISRFFQETECLSKTCISVENCLQLLQKFFNVGDFTKKWNAFLRLVSPWKRVDCCCNNASMWAILTRNVMLT
jgi:hypothetical protein